MEKIILGIVGPLSGGKDTVADYLVEKYGFINISTGDMIRDYIKDNGLGEPERDLMQKVANELRAKHGPDHFVKMALKNKSNRIIVSGIRAVAAAQGLLDLGGLIISCDAPIKMRYDRVTSRNRVGDEVTFEKFKAQEEAEKNDDDPTVQNIPGVMKMAKHEIENDRTIEELNKKIEVIVKELGI